MTAFAGRGSLSARIYDSPTTAGQVEVIHEACKSISCCTACEFEDLLLYIKQLATSIYNKGTVRRVGFASDHHRMFLMPMLGLTSEWKPILSADTPYSKAYAGYLTSHSGPKQSQKDLDAHQRSILQHSQLDLNALDYTFKGDALDSNLFAKIVRGGIRESWRVWESSTHVAFLTPFPNIPCATVLVPRQHLPSDIFSLSDQDYLALVQATFQVMHLLKKALQVQHIGIFFEGFEIDYAHVKLYPIPLLSSSRTDEDSNGEFHKIYPGFLTTQSGPRRSEKELEEMFEYIKA